MKFIKDKVRDAAQKGQVTANSANTMRSWSHP